MKELTIEEKAKAYDEAIEYAYYLISERCKEGTEGSFHRSDLQKMFPTLAESEDEKIRKAIIKIVKKDEERIGTNAHLKKIQWLEKQGEKGTNGNEREIPNSEQKPTWKPSGEQMKFLWKYAEQNNYDGRILTSLYNDLKKLKG